MVLGIPVQTEKPDKEREVPAIVVEGLTKEFVIPHERRTTLFENIRGMLTPNSYEKFTALKDISFTINKGDSLGIIGENGSGKSTLLKIICNILKPSQGGVTVSGTITPFLELGVGFQPDLTARENIEVYGTIMGLTGRQIATNMDSVLEFAGLKKFRDMKLKNFSSGMQVRLAFATAIQMVPDILVVDEVLAVGDMEFQQKCFDVFRDYKKRGITLVLVSHDLASVRRFCDKALLLRSGRMVAYGEVNEIIDKYVYNINLPETPDPKVSDVKDYQDKTPEARDDQGKQKNRDRIIEITGVEIIDKYGHSGSRFNSGDPFVVSVHYCAHKSVEEPTFGIGIIDEKGNYCFGTHTGLRGFSTGTTYGKGTMRFKIGKLPILEGKYFITIAIASKDLSVTFDVHDKAYSFLVINNTNDIGFIKLDCDFDINHDPGKETPVTGAAETDRNS